MVAVKIPSGCDAQITQTSSQLSLKTKVRPFICVPSSGHLCLCLLLPQDSDKVATFDMKLMDIDAEHLAIPVSFFFFFLTSDISRVVSFFLRH